MTPLSLTEGERVALDTTAGIAALLALTPLILSGPTTFTLAPPDLLLSCDPAVLVSQTKGRGVLMIADLRGHPGSNP